MRIAIKFVLVALVFAFPPVFLVVCRRPLYAIVRFPVQVQSE